MSLAGELPVEHGVAAGFGSMPVGHQVDVRRVQPLPEDGTNARRWRKNEMGEYTIGGRN